MKIQNDIKLVVANSIIHKLKECVKNAHPNEACGLIFGNIKELQNSDEKNNFYYEFKATAFRCIPSDRASTVSFLIENVEVLNEIIISVISNSHQEKLQLISIFHSHPSGTTPSSIDVKNMEFLDQFSDSSNRFTSKAFKNLIWVIMDSQNFKISAYIYFDAELQKIRIIQI